jgi:hypothetical protein
MKPGASRTLCLAAAIAAAAAWLVWCAWTVSPSPNPDYAVVVTMVRDMASFRAFPTFFYGQPYMGSLEPAFSALIALVLGPSPFVVCLGTALVGLAAVLLAADLARRIGGPVAGAAALLLALPGPLLWTWFLASPRGGYAVCALLCAAGLRLAALGRVRDEDGRPLPAALAAFGLLCGLAWWNTWLALPALFGAGLVILARLRRAALSPRAWAPALATFAASSLPWWIWNAAHGWSSLATSAQSPAAPGWGVWRIALGERLSGFVGGFAFGAGLWRHPAGWLLAAVAALAAVGAFRARRDRTVRRLLAAVAVHAAVFAVAYARTGFGAPDDSARYFFALVPGFAAAGGVLAAAALRAERGPIALRVLPAVALLAALVVFSVRQGVVCAHVLSNERTNGEILAAAAHELGRETGSPGATEPFFAYYDRFGANWMSDEAVVAVPPFLARVPRFIAALEETDSPGVLAGYDDFSSFLSGSGGTAERSRAGGFDLLRRCVPPPPARDLPPGTILSVVDGAGLDWTEALLDGNLATTDFAKDGPGRGVRLDIALCGETETTGIVLAKMPRGRATGWRAEAVLPDGSTRLLAEAPRMRDWYWSGPRFYQGGAATRWELRWPPARVSALRISFFHSGPDHAVRAADLRLLAPPPADGPAAPRDAASALRAARADLAAVRAVLASMEAARGPAALYADRWALARLDGRTEPAMDPLRRMPSRIGAALDAYDRLDPLARNRVVVPAGQRDSAVRTLAAAGLVPDAEERTGGLVVLDVPPARPDDAAAASFFARGCVRFACGRLLLDRAPEIEPGDVERTPFAGGRAVLAGARLADGPARPGSAVRLELAFEFPRRGERPDSPWCLADFRLGGRSVFRGACRLGAPHPADGGADLPETETRVLAVPVPPDAPAGDYEVRIGLGGRDAAVLRRPLAVAP